MNVLNYKDSSYRTTEGHFGRFYGKELHSIAEGKVLYELLPLKNAKYHDFGLLKAPPTEQ